MAGGHLQEVRQQQGVNILISHFKLIYQVYFQQSNIQPKVKCNISFIVFTNLQFIALYFSRGQVSQVHTVPELALVRLDHVSSGCLPEVIKKENIQTLSSKSGPF